MKFYSFKFSIFKVQIMRPKKFNFIDGLVSRLSLQEKNLECEILIKAASSQLLSVFLNLCLLSLYTY